jgi:RNA polymerase sigma-70 factor (ECF subfamily)
MDAKEFAGRAETSEALNGALGDEPGRVLSVLVRAFGDVDLAEDALQDAAAIALQRWPSEGIPSNPAGWLVTTARRRGIDRLRRVAIEERKRTELTALTRLELDIDHLSDTDRPVGDERLALIFACCHPVLPMDGRVALTLRCVGGLTTAEVARPFLVTESTMKQRISRTKRALRDAGVSLALPRGEQLAARVPDVLAVLYLVFNEGYVTTRGDRLRRSDLTSEGIRLTRLVASKLPTAEALGLLALMLFHEARGPGRSAGDGDGPLVPMDEQDRTAWDRATIDEANQLLAAASQADAPGPYQVQAAIASVHANARSPEATDWATILRLYDALAAELPTAVVQLNRAVAYGMVHGPAAGLERIGELAERRGLERYHLLHAARADMLRRQDRLGEAAEAYDIAAGLTDNDAERQYLERRRSECREKATR